MGSAVAPGGVDESSMDNAAVDVAPTGPDTLVRRIVGKLPRWLVLTLTVLGFAAPVGMYFQMVHRYAINVVFWDQFDDVTVIKASFSHFFPWGVMWAQHNDTRIFFPNLIVVLLAHTLQFNIVIEEYLSASILVAAIALIICAHKRRSPSVPWLFYCPVAIVMLSLVQYQNALWGFQIAWPLTMLGLAAAIFFLDRIELRWAFVGLAILAAVIGTLSLIQGFLIWPVGFVLLYHRRRLMTAVPWGVAAATTAAVYFRNFDSTLGSGYPGYASHHLVDSIKFYLYALGSVLGVPYSANPQDTSNQWVQLFGLATVVVAVIAILLFGIKRDSSTGSPIGVVLVLFALAFAAMVTKGRIIGGLLFAGASRYTTFDLLVLTGTYLALLGHPPIPEIFTKWRRSTADQAPSVDSANAEDRERGWPTRVLLPAIFALAGLLIAIQVPVGFHYGSQGAAVFSTYPRMALALEQNIHQFTSAQAASLYFSFEPGPWVIERIDFLQSHHLGFFNSTGKP